MRLKVLTVAAGLVVLAAIGCFLLFRDTQKELLVIVQPVAGTMVRPGDAVPIEISLARGFKPKRIGVTSRVASTTLERPAIRGTLVIPREAIGPIEIMAMAIDPLIDMQRDANGSFAIANADELANAKIGSDSVKIMVKVAARPTALRIVNPVQYVTLNPDGTSDTVTLGVQATYDDGVTRVLSGTGVPVKFRSSDPHVATVDDQGVLTGHRRGEAIVTASLDGASDKTEVVVAPRSW